MSCTNCLLYERPAQTSSANGEILSCSHLPGQRERFTSISFNFQNQIIFTQARRLVRPLYYGRAPGIKGWLRENVPALALRYTTVMRYKAAAKKLRQVVELPDPIPVAAVLDGDGAGEGTGVLDGAGQEVLAGTERTEQKRDYCAEN